MGAYKGWCEMSAKANDKVLKFIWLTLACGPNSTYQFKLFAEFKDINELYETTEFYSFKLPADVLAKLMNKDLKAAQEIQKKCQTMGIEILCFDDENYPKKLRKIKDPPLVLYYKGKMMNFDKKFCVSMVGTRKMTEPGKQSAEYLAGQYGKLDLIVISGIAKGIDSACQKAALSYGGSVVGVIGNSIDTIYPKENAALFNKLYKRGLVISEYWPGCVTKAECFPRRNRIIAGLADVVVIVEAPKGSGAIITANHAIRQGKKVFVAPMPLTGEYEGAAALVRMGEAQIISDPLDVLEDYKGSTEAVRLPKVDAMEVYMSYQNAPNDGLTEAERRENVYNFLLEELDANGPETLTEVLDKAQEYTIRQLVRAATELELDGFIQKTAGGRYDTVPVDNHNQAEGANE